jgi:hypothetical protein
MRAIKVAVISAGGLSAMVVVAGVQMGLVAAENELKAEAVADANGNLHVPDAYRTTYQFLGTWAVAADQGHGSAELHVVYAFKGCVKSRPLWLTFSSNIVLPFLIAAAARRTE